MWRVSAWVRPAIIPYEVASYALDGHECAHNIAYWTGRGYLGLGRSAAGMLDAEDFDRLAGLFPGVSCSRRCVPRASGAT